MTEFLKYARQRLDRCKNRLISARESVEREQQELETAMAQEQVVLESQKIVQEIAQKLQHDAHQQIARVVSKCLKAVWPEDPYTLKIEFVKRRGKTEADFAYYRGGNRIEPRQTSGAVRQVVALALRLVAITLSQPARRKILVLDEPLAGLDRESMARVGALLESLAEELGVQILLTTHSELLQIGKVIRL